MQAVVELAEKSVEQVPLGLVVPVSGGAAGIVVSASIGGRPQRRPDGRRRRPVRRVRILALGCGDAADGAMLSATSERPEGKQPDSNVATTGPAAPGKYLG